MTNRLQVGDIVFIPPYIQGKVVEVDDHPLEYAQVKVEMLTPVGTSYAWASCRMARKL